MTDFPFNPFYRKKRELKEVKNELSVQRQKYYNDIRDIKLEFGLKEDKLLEYEKDLKEKYLQLKELSNQNSQIQLFRSLLPSLVQYSNSQNIEKENKKFIDELIQDLLILSFREK